MKIIIQDGVDHRKATVAGLAFWIGVGFQNQLIFADLLGEGFLGVLLGNGMTAGAIVAIIMMVFHGSDKPAARRLQVALDSDALPKMDEFLRGFAAKGGWDAATTERLVLVGEETLASLFPEEGRTQHGRKRGACCHRPSPWPRSGAGVCVGSRGGELGGPAGVSGRNAR